MTLISRDAGARFQNGLHGARGGGVVVAEDAVRTRIERQQRARGLVAAGIVVGVHHVRIGDGKAGLGQRLAIAFHAAHSRCQRRPGDVRDAAAAPFDEVVVARRPMASSSAPT